MVELARESRSLLQTELAEKIGIPQGNLSRMERGDVGIKEEILTNISKVLNYPIHFFYQDKRISVSDTHYRKAIVLDQKTKLKAEAIMNIYKFNIEEMLKSLEIKVNVPIITDLYESPAKVAMYLRSYWKVDRGPINDIAKLIEDNGIIIVPMDFETDKIDGRTLLTNTGHPIIFLNTRASSDRQRLTVCHELGHVIMHVNSSPVFCDDEEDAAFEFGQEFLMPYSECQFDLNEKTTIEKLVDLKRYWKVSIQAMITRMLKTGIISKNRGRYLWSIVVAKKWRISEPIELTPPAPTLLKRMIAALQNGLHYNSDDLSAIFCLNKGEFEQRYLPNQGKLKIV
jgi:Zn-dependent peptidase ImmA (M78 family)